MELTLNNFENQVGAVNRLAIVAPTSYILNCHKSCSPAVGQIVNAIIAAPPGKLLYQMKLNTIYAPTGNPENWSLEALSATKSLAIVGVSPTA